MVKKKKSLILWQKPMVTVLAGLSLPVAASVYFFGWRSILVLFVANMFAFVTEYVFSLVYKEPISAAVFVTGTLFALTLPPTIPYWMAGMGVVFGVVFGKMAVGGFGRNIFNPAIVGRVFLYINFGGFMTGTKVWSRPWSGVPGGFVQAGFDTVTQATPMKIAAEGGTVPLMDLFLGNISGCLGETSALLILAGGLYLLWKKVADKKVVFSTLLLFIVTQGVFYFAGRGEDPLTALLSGGVMFGIFFMATDLVTSCSTKTGKWIYGGMIGLLTVLIRIFASWPEGIMFAILLANMFGPIIDYAVKEKKNRKKAA